MSKQSMKYAVHLFILLLILVSCASSETRSDGDDLDEPPSSTTVKNVILVIGDGMGPQQVGLLLEYARYQGSTTTFERLAEEGVVGLAMTTPEEALVVDSACSASHLATGQPAPLEALGVDLDGEPLQNVAQAAQSRGKSTGLISDTRITHATPAAFASHIAHRSLENEIAQQMIAADVDVLLSGGLRHFLPQGVNDDDEVRGRYHERIGHAFDIASRRSDDIDVLQLAEEAGYELIFDRQTLSQTRGPKVLGLFSNSSMMDAINERSSREEQTRREPSLVEMSEQALAILSQNEAGFFLMIEAGQIDWAGHDNDTGTLLHEVIRLDETLAMLHEWVSGRDDTLLVITADHETGGFGFSYSGHDIDEGRALPGQAFEGRLYRPDYNFGSPQVFEALLAQRATYAEIFTRFDQGEDQSPEALVELVNANLGFSIDASEAENILRRSPNRLFHDDHPYLTAETLPHVDDFHPFYVYGDDIRRNLLGRALSSQQNVVWSTGTHTHTPVPVVAWGPEHVVRRFDRFLHLMDVGQILIDVVGD